MTGGRLKKLGKYFQDDNFMFTYGDGLGNINLKKLLTFHKKYGVKSQNILGHSDIAPDRKKDPGEKFPWKYFSKNKIGYWHNLKEN